MPEGESREAGPLKKGKKVDSNNDEEEVEDNDNNNNNNNNNNNRAEERLDCTYLFLIC